MGHATKASSMLVHKLRLQRGWTQEHLAELKHPLILWGSIGWGIGLVVHGLNVFEVINFLGPNWEKKQIEKLGQAAMTRRVDVFTR
jgi:hypothetical protein